MDAGGLERKMNGQNHEHVDISSFWEQQARALEEIKQAGGFAPYAETMPNLDEAFQSDDKLRCIDEGTPDGFRAAGSGIAYVITAGLDKGLKGYDAINTGLDAAAEAFRDADLDGVFSHEECGAAKLVYGAFSDEFKSQLKKDHGITSSDEFGDYFAKELAKKMGKEYKGRIGIGEMTRPSGAHVTRVTYIDGTGRFNPDAIEGLPQGFVVSRKYLGAEQTAVEASVSVGISTGNHGFGKRIDSDHPHVLVAVGSPNDPKLSTESLMKELQPLLSDPKYKNKLIVDGFTAPSNITY
jgi:hypothetical protein